MIKQQPSPRSPALEWERWIKGVLKAELKLRDMTYADLVAGLAQLGVRETEANLRNKVSRGRFSAIFFFQCMSALGVDRVDVRRIKT